VRPRASACSPIEQLTPSSIARSFGWLACEMTNCSSDAPVSLSRELTTAGCTSTTSDAQCSSSSSESSDVVIRLAITANDGGSRQL